MIAIDDKIILSDREMSIIFAVVWSDDGWIECTSCRAVIDCRTIRGSFLFFFSLIDFLFLRRGGFVWLVN